MDIEKIFNDLESNHVHECEEAKKKLVDLFMQNKEQWIVQNTMDYFLRTGSLRIIEVLVKVQAPHDGYIFDRLSEWLKTPANRVQALNLFCFVVRKHPTWLFKVEKHRLFKDIFKLLATEKEIVPLMSALLCVITLLPIIPNLVPNFLDDLFEVFGHLASWNCQNPNRLSDDKLVHLQLGLQMLFHRLYGMYPCNFLAYLIDFAKKEKQAIFHHTIKPLMATVRVHPMLVTASMESERSNSRWKEMEPHDVVVECAEVSLPVSHQDFNAEQTAVNFATCDWFDTPGGLSTPGVCGHKERYSGATYPYNDSRQQLFSRFDSSASSGSNAVIWSPHNHINTSGAIPLTPTSSYVMQLTNTVSNTLNNHLLSLTGSSPPEAAVEATPETTPMKEVKDYKQRGMPLSSNASNPHAVRAILVSSQPSSPMRKENQFNFSEVSASSATATATTSSFVDQQVTKHGVTRFSTTLHDRMVQQIMHDRNSSQNPTTSQSTDGVLLQLDPDLPLPYLNSKFDAECDFNPTYVETSQQSNSYPAVEHIAKGCDDCNETDRSMCTEGGLQTATSRSMAKLVSKGMRRNRMTSYCYNDSSCEKIGASSKQSAKFMDSVVAETAKVRRTKSCSSIFLAPLQREEKDLTKRKNNERRLQKSGKMLTIAARCNSKVINSSTINISSRFTQTVQTWPQNYENTLFQMFVDNNNLRNAYESNSCSKLYPQEMLDQYIIRTIKSKENFDAGYRLDQEHIQLLCLQLQYERYRREIHAERNRRLMGRSRDKRSLEMERDRLRDQLKNFATKNEELMQQIDKTKKDANENREMHLQEVNALKAKYQIEMEQSKTLRQTNENLQARLNEELANSKEINFESELLRGQIFNMSTECQHAQLNAEIGLQCKQELARLEAEFVVMGEVQMKCRDRLVEMDNYRARDEEMSILQESYNMELRELKHVLEEKTSQLDSAKHKVGELQSQLVNNEKVITDQKRLLKTVKDEYEEKFKALNKKYEVQKTIILQMEEKIISLHKTQAPVPLNAFSPDTDKTDTASSMDRNSPLSTSLASSESLSASLRSTELRNLQQLVETPFVDPVSISNIKELKHASVNDIKSSAVTVTSGAGNASSGKSGHTAHTFEISTASSSQPHVHPHLHLQQQKQISTSQTTDQYQTNLRRQI